jgi:4-amino-4-deoxy-L-arabinose transferase-like glycosyltransferase
MKYVEQTEVDTPIRADAAQYVAYGYNLYYHGVFSKELSPKPSPDSYRSPGYPLLISLAFKIGGKRYFYPVVIYFQIILSALLVPLTFLVGIRFLSSTWSLLAAIFVAISPHLVSMTNYLLTETLFSFVLLSAICLFCMALERKHIIFFVTSGMLFGMAYLANETALFIPFIVIAASIYFRFKRGNITKKIFVNMLACLIIFSVFPAAWTWRNHNLNSEAAQGSSRAIASMSHGAYPDFIYKDKKFRYFPYREDPMQPLFSSSFGNFSTILFERFKERPIRYLSWYIFEKPYYLWSWSILQGQGDIYVYPVKSSLYQKNVTAEISRKFMQVLHPFVLVAALAGIIIFLRKNRANEYISLPFAVIVYYTILYTVFAPWPRYSVPLRPELYLFAIWTCSVLLKKYQSRER